MCCLCGAECTSLTADALPNTNAANILVDIKAFLKGWFDKCSEAHQRAHKELSTFQLKAKKPSHTHTHVLNAEVTFHPTQSNPRHLHFLLYNSWKLNTKLSYQPPFEVIFIFFFETDRDPLLLPLSFFPCSAPIPSSYFLDLWDGVPGMSPALTLPSTAPLWWADNDNNGAARRRYKGHECSALDV